MMLLELALTAIISHPNIIRLLKNYSFSSVAFGGIRQYPKVKTQETRY